VLVDELEASAPPLDLALDEPRADGASDEDERDDDGPEPERHAARYTGTPAEIGVALGRRGAHERGMHDPIATFSEWYAEAQDIGLVEPSHVVLATANQGGRPTSRIVLLKGHDARGFVVYTNLESRKGRELDENPRASLLFYWGQLGRQVRVDGPVERVTDEEADAYFASRSRESQLGAWASDQSRPLESRAALEARFAEVTAKYEGGPVPRPPHWSGYRVVPEEIELWQARDHRLHHREQYTREAEGWSMVLLNP
jgi:pyridoxamine 5'-phosphate oxidase